MASLKDKRVVVVGGGSGIGLAVAEGALADGAQVVVASSNAQRVQAAAARLGERAEALAVDVTDEAEVARFAKSVGGLDHLVFTAGDWGGPRRGSLADTDIDAAASVFGVRFWGALRCAKHLAGQVAPGGSIVLTNGMIAHKPTKGSSVSTAMAGAIEHLTRALAVELAPVRVNCVCPGAIRTGVWDSIPEDQREARLQQMTARLPIARVGEPDEAAEAYLYLLRGGYTTGQVLRVDGGSSVQ